MMGSILGMAGCRKGTISVGDIGGVWSSGDGSGGVLDGDDLTESES